MFICRYTQITSHPGLVARLLVTALPHMPVSQKFSGPLIPIRGVRRQDVKYLRCSTKLESHGEASSEQFTYCINEQSM